MRQWIAPALVLLSAAAVSAQTGGSPLGPGLGTVGRAPAPAPADDGFRPPAFKPLRFDEDYEYLKDAEKAVDPLDPIKYVELFGREGWYASFGGEVRERFEVIRNELFGFTPADADGFNHTLLQRYMGHADLHLGDHVRLFGQFKSTHESGRVAGSRPQIDRNDFDLHQGFFDLSLPGGGKRAVVRGGRQELRYGSGRLLDVREGPNNRLSFDAAKVLATVGDWKVDGVWGRPVDNRPGAFDDLPDPRRSLWGVYGTRPAGDGRPLTIDAYYLGYENRRAAFFQGRGEEVRHTLGVRVERRGQPLEFNHEVFWQFGEFAGGRIAAWSVATATRYQIADLPLKPRIGLRADVASGDGDPADRTLGTFNPLFPSAAYFNLGDPIGPANVYDLHPVIDLFVREHLTVTLDWDFFWRQWLTDGVYTIAGQPIPTTDRRSRARYVGDTPAVTITWSPDRHWTVLATYAHFFPGRYLRETTPGRDLGFFTLWTAYKF